MKAALGSVFVVAALIAFPAPMRAAMPQAAKSADHNLDERIEKRIDTSTLKKYGVKVSVTNGVATLTGTVATEADRAKAPQLATIPGISRVENQLIAFVNLSSSDDFIIANFFIMRWVDAQQLQLDLPFAFTD